MGHYYTPTGEPCHEVPCKSDPNKMRPTTVADAKKLGLLPSVTTVCDALDKPALVAWKAQQAALAVLTAPRNENEKLDSFVYRVLEVERQHEQEAKQARDLGTEIHDALDALAAGRTDISPNIEPWVIPAWKFVQSELVGGGRIFATEKVLVGAGYAGRTDLIVDTPSAWIVTDYKTCKTVPRDSWPEHKMQTAAYRHALPTECNGKPVRCGNLYISTREQGAFAWRENDSIDRHFRAFRAVLEYWYAINDYNTEQK